MNNPRRLGRGLEALLGRPFDPDGNYEQAPAGEAPQEGPPRQAPVASIDSNPFQPRREFDETELLALADSIRQYGVLQPLVVRAVGERYQLIAGERRLRAAQRAGLHEIPVQIVEADDRRMSEIAIVENLQRQDLNAIEKAQAFANYLAQFHVTQEELAGKLNIDRSTVSNLIRLLELPPEIHDAVRRGAISAGHARALLPLGDADEQRRAGERIEREKLSVRETEAWVSEFVHRADAEPLSVIGSDGEPAPSHKPRNDQLAALEQELRMALGTKVELRSSARHRGRIVIHFANLAEFERLQSLLAPAGVARHAA